MADYIKGFRFFCQKVLPLVYDDSLSYYEVLCKAINKMNEINNVVNLHSDSIEDLGERYSDLENKVEGLIENLVDVIVPWDSSIAYRIFSIVEYQGTNYIAVQDVPIGTMITNTEYWQPANTIVEQINAIGVEVSEISSEITPHVQINNDMGLLFPHLNTDYVTPGLCCILYKGEHCTIIDLGLYDSFPDIKNAIDNKGIKYIDNIFITHYHGDHTGWRYGVDNDKAYDQWKESFDMSNTVFYLPPVSSMYEEGPDRINASFPDNTKIMMESGAIYRWENIKITPYNIAPADFVYYESLSSFDYNSCSAIIYAEYEGFRFLCSGDVTKEAQDRIYSLGNCKRSDIMTAPHHGVNGTGSTDFINSISPLYLYIPAGNISQTNGYRDPNIALTYLGGSVFSNQITTDSVEFSFGKTGVTGVKGNPIIITQYSIEGDNIIYCDENYTGSNDDGTSSRPYRTIRRAISAARGNTKIYLMSDITAPAIVTAANGYVTIEGNGHEIKEAFSGYPGSHVKVNNVIFNAMGLTRASYEETNCTHKALVNIVSSMAWIDTPTWIGSGYGSCITGNKSFVIVTQPTAKDSGATNLINMYDSFTDGMFSNSSLGDCRGLINSRGFVDFGRLGEPESNLIRYFANANVRPLVTYDTATNRLVIAAGGALHYINAT